MAPYVGKFALVILVSSLCQTLATASPDSTTADGLVTNAPSNNTVDTCERTKVSTYTRQISHKWIVKKPNRYFNTSTRSDADGYLRVGSTIHLENKYGGNWTVQMMSSSERYLDIHFNATFPPDYENSPNVIMAGAFFNFKNVTKEASCFDAFPEPAAPGKWKGSCYFQFEISETEKLIPSDYFTVLFELRLVYANFSQMLTTGVECDTLRLDAFNRSQQDAAMELLTTPLSTQVPLEDIYAKISKHRITLEWSIQTASGLFRKPMESNNPRSLGKLLMPDMIGAFNCYDKIVQKSLCFPCQEHTSIYVSYLCLAGRTTWVQVKNLSLGQELEVVLGTRSHKYGMQLLSIGCPQIAFTAGPNYTKTIPEDSIRGGDLFKKANVAITTKELEELKSGVVVQMEFDFVYGIHKAV